MFENFRLKRWRKKNLFNNYLWYSSKVHLIAFEIKIIKKQHKQEIDNLKLRICVLENAMKEHKHISPRDILGMSDGSSNGAVGCRSAYNNMGKIPNRKKK